MPRVGTGRSAGRCEDVDEDLKVLCRCVGRQSKKVYTKCNEPKVWIC